MLKKHKNKKGDISIMIQRLQNKLNQLMQKRKEKGGFTLIELIIVIVIIAILVMIAMPDFQSTLGNSKVASAQENIKVLGDATLKYYSEMGNLPDGVNDIKGLKNALTANKTKGGQTYGPWLKKNAKLEDPWGNEYIVIFEEGGEFDIISKGADGKEGSDDDIHYNNLGGDPDENDNK